MPFSCAMPTSISCGLRTTLRRKAFWRPATAHGIYVEEESAVCFVHTNGRSWVADANQIRNLLPAT